MTPRLAPTFVASTQKSLKAWMATSLRTYLGYLSLFLRHGRSMAGTGSSLKGGRASCSTQLRQASACPHSVKRNHGLHARGLQATVWLLQQHSCRDLHRSRLSRSRHTPAAAPTSSTSSKESTHFVSQNMTQCSVRSGRLNAYTSVLQK